jgi:hypothetical protein
MPGSKTIIIPAAGQARANEFMNILDPDLGGSKTFTAGCSATGIAPITHYIAVGWFDDNTMTAFSSQANFWALVSSLATARGRPLVSSQAQCNAAYAACIFGSGNDPWGTLAAAGLKLI